MNKLPHFKIWSIHNVVVMTEMSLTGFYNSMCTEINHKVLYPKVASTLSSLTCAENEKFI